MPRYKVLISERITHKFIIEAQNEKEAEKLLENGPGDLDPVDSDTLDWIIADVVEEEAIEDETTDWRRRKMQEARASWNTIYTSKDGFECQLTLRDDDENALAQRVQAITKSINDSGGKPVARRNGNGRSSGRKNGSPGNSGDEKTYVDEKGVRRCNLILKNGKRCEQPVTEKEGKYGLFWSCPDYKEHAK